MIGGANGGWTEAEVRDNHHAEAAPDARWVDITTDAEGAALRRREAETS